MSNDKKRFFKLLRHLTLVFVIAFGLMSIIGSGQSENDAGGTATGKGTTATVTGISLVASPANLDADGVSTSTITATVTMSDGSISSGDTVSFSLTGSGTLSASSAATADGIATVTYTAGTTRGTDTITATANNIERETTIGLSDIPDSFSLSLSQTSVKSDNSDSSTVTATVLNKKMVPVQGTQVTFTATGGMISSDTAITDENGEAAITFSSGTTEKRNRVVTIIASITGFDDKQIPILVTGTELLLSSSETALEVNPSDPDTSTATLIVTLVDAGQASIYDALVSVSLDATSTGAVTFDSVDNTYQTDVNGKVEVGVTGTLAGDVIVKVEALGATATQTYTVDVIGEAFKIDSPTEDPYSLSTNTNLTITVNAPDQTNVLFSTTFGTLTGTTETGQAVKEPVSGGAASVVLSSPSAGVATVQASDYDDASTKDLMSVIISAPSSEASQIALQANANVVARSTEDLSNTVILTATVKNASDQVVGNAPVIFSIKSDTTTGGGETISPAVVYTDDYGVATATFTSGSLSSDADGVTVTASVVGALIPIESEPIAIVIGGTAASIAIGSATTVSSVNNNTAYQLAMSVLVADSNGNPMKNTNVSLKLWPTRYATGLNVLTIDGEYDNEDLNRNLILDPGEDLNGDGQLTPPSSAAGSLPSTVTTDDNGVADFKLVYLKDSASYIEAEVTASTLVLGTETQSVTKFWLPWMKTEQDSLGPSPYN
jgi:hypothetical protein